MESLTKLNQEILSCTRCPRLLHYCQRVGEVKKKAFLNWDYHALPVPHFGDPAAELLVVGLAPAAHGANRTGRMFTGDRSGEWLYRALHKQGFANQPLSESIGDGLKLNNVLITAVNHCAPPANKPTPEEIDHCQPFLQKVYDLPQFSVIIALGAIAWNAVIHADCANPKSRLKEQRKYELKFQHGRELELANGRNLIGSFHPSQQNTFTKKLTEPMFDQIFSRAHMLLKK